jgi:hypothetical protein
MTQFIIRYNKVLDEITKAHCLTLPKYAERAAQTTDMAVVNAQIKAYKEAGILIKDKVISALAHVAKRPFPYSVVNINIVWVLQRSEAYSMIFPVSLSTDQFIISITHELAHLSWALYTPEFLEKYKNISKSIRDHVVVNAMLQYLWCDILNRPHYMEMSKDSAKRHSTDDYTKAWEIVEKEGYMNILSSAIKPVSNDT